MGKSSSTNQTQHQTTSMTTTPTNPAYVDSTLANLTGKVNDLANADPYGFIAGPDALQTQAGTGAAGLTGTPGLYAGSTDLATSVGQMNAPDIASMMNPFKGAFDNRVINPALAGFDQNAGLVNAQNRLNLGNDTTFGGSGAAITDSLTHGQQALARGQLQGGLLSDQFKTALQGATSQAGVNQAQQGLRLNAAGQLTSNANDMGVTDRANVGTQANIGTLLQALNQARVGAPISLAGTTAGILGSLPLGLEHGQNSNGTMDGTSSSHTTESDPLGSLGSLAMTGASLFSGGQGLSALGGGLGGFMNGVGTVGPGAAFSNLFSGASTPVSATGSGLVSALGRSW